MALLRIEPELDEQTGRFCLAIYHPADATQPAFTTAPRYLTAAAAEVDFLAILAAAANNGGRRA